VVNGSLAMNRATPHRAPRRDRDSFRVVPEETPSGEQLYAVLGPTGVPLYTFTDIHAAIAEAAELNAPGSSGQLTSRLEGLR
jgi:hypothetical protein